MSNRFHINFLSALFLGVLFIGVSAHSVFAAQITQHMKLGSQGEQVKTLQVILAKDAAIYPEGRVSGYYGPLTVAAVKRFQKKHGIAQLGVVGPQTLKKLNEVSGTTSTAPVSTPSSTTATSAQFEFSGWIPYWAKEKGVAEARAHLGQLQEINPFAYTVKQDGTLFDAMKINELPWTPLLTEARAKKVRIVPSILWTDADAMHATFSSPTKRKAHIASIMQTVNDNNFDGIDLDYEGKHAKTMPYFSLFLKELYAVSGNKWIQCTIEPRTPLDARYDTIPEDIQYANDFVEINKYCDRVRIMTYDQGAIDVKLNRAGTGPYVPVADPLWVKKVVDETAKVIPKRKLVIGVTTYGYEYEVTPLAKGYRYARQFSLSHTYALDMAKAFGITPVRNRAGEMSFSYIPTDDASVAQPKNGDATSTITQSNNVVSPTAVGEVASGVTIGSATPTRLIWWSDGGAVKQKVDLARELGVRGVAVFKIDGGADPLVWDALK